MGLFTREAVGGELGDGAARKPGVAQVSILFSCVILLFILFGFRVQRKEFYSGILITEFVLIMLPAVIYLLAFRYDFKSVLRLNRISLINVLLIFLIMLFAIPLAGLFNLANLWLVNTVFGKVIVQQPPVAQNVAGLLLNILVIGGAAGIGEEFLFRGVIQRGFERFGPVRSILAAAFLFSLTHLDFQKIFGTFILGALIGFIVYRSNSLYGGILAHFTNNSAAVVMGFAAAKLTEMMRGAGVQVPQEQPDLNGYFAALAGMPKPQLMIAAFFYGFVILIILMIFAALMYAFVTTTGRPAETGRDAGTAASAGLLWLLPGLALIAGIYFMEVMKFRGLGNGFLDAVRAFLGA